MAVFLLHLQLLFPIKHFVFQTSVWLFSFAPFLLGSDVFVEHITSNSGLPSMSIYEMAQSPSGHMYIATDKGLYKYDGTSFEMISKDTYRQSAYQFTFINDSTFVFINSDKHLCLGVNDNVSCSDIGLDYIPYGIQNIQDSLLYLVAPVSGKRQEILYDLPKQEVIRSDYGKKFQQDQISFTGQYSKVFSAKDINGPLQKGFVSYNDSLLIRKPFISGDYSSVGNKSWELTEKELIQYSYRGNDILVDKIPLQNHFLNDFVRCIYALDESTIIIGSKNGLKYVDIKNKRILKEILTETQVNSITKDKNNCLWIGTNGKGIFKIPAIKSSSSLNFKNEIQYLNIADNASLLLQTKDGLRIIDVNESTDLSWRIKEKPIFDFITNHQNYILTSSSIMRVDREKKTLNRLALPKTVYKGSFKDMVQIDESRLLVTSSGGVLIASLSKKKNSITKIENIYPSNTSKVYKGKNNDIFILSTDGLLRYELKKNSVSIVENHIKSSAIKKMSLSDTNDRLYTTWDSQLFISKKDSLKEVALDEKTLPENPTIVDHIAVGNLFYVFCKEGVFTISNTGEMSDFLFTNPRIPLKSLKHIHYSNQLFTLVYPQNILQIKQKDLFQSANRVEPLLISNSKINEKHLNLLNYKKIPYNKNNIQLSVRPATLLQQNTRIFYRIEGLSDAWEKVDANNSTIRLPNLRPGKYRIYGGATANSFIEKKEIPLLHSFVIQKPFWQTIWFNLLMGLLLIFSTIRIMSIFNARKQREYQLSLELIETKNKAFRAQIKPHLIFNALSGLMGLIASNRKEDALKHTNELSIFLRNTLFASEKEWVTIEDEINLVQSYVSIEKIRFNNRFTLQVDLDKTLNAASIHIPSFLLQPIVENSIKHGFKDKNGEKTITIKIERHSEKILKFMIADNGVGLPKQAEIKKGFGLTLVEKRLRSMTKKEQKPLLITPNPTGGVLVTLLVPFKRNL